MSDLDRLIAEADPEGKLEKVRGLKPLNPTATIVPHFYAEEDVHAALAELKAKLAAAEERVTEFIEGSPLDVADHLVSAYQYEAERWEWVARLFNRMLTNSTGYDQLPAALDRFETQERWDHAADHWTETQP